MVDGKWGLGRDKRDGDLGLGVEEWDTNHECRISNPRTHFVHSPHKTQRLGPVVTCDAVLPCPIDVRSKEFAALDEL